MGDKVVNLLLDFMRSISTIASVVIVGRTIGHGLEELFMVECDRCNSMGKVTCIKCFGTKTLARRPAQRVPNTHIYNRRHEDLQECFVCGPTTLHDNFGPLCARELGEEEEIYEKDRI